MGSIDKMLRIVIALVFAVLIYLKVVEGTTAYVLGALGGVFVLTSLVSFCPLYLPFGINTCKK
jgi:Protein of unknown function (DUF2892)